MSRGLSRTRVTAAALEVVANEGLDKLTMRKVAALLDVEAMSLYRHVRNKADLLDALHDDLLGQVPLPGEGPWPEQMQLLATSFREVLFAHPRCVPLLATRAATKPQALAVLEGGIELLTSQGLSEDHAVVAFQTVFCFVVGHAVFHTAGGLAPGDNEWSQFEFTEGLAALVLGLQLRFQPTAD